MYLVNEAMIFGAHFLLCLLFGLQNKDTFSDTCCFKTLTSYPKSNVSVYDRKCQMISTYGLKLAALQVHPLASIFLFMRLFSIFFQYLTLVIAPGSLARPLGGPGPGGHRSRGHQSVALC